MLRYLGYMNYKLLICFMNRVFFLHIFLFQAIQYTHPVHKISFIARDMSDNRAFGYIFGVGDGTHKFFAIKTEKAVRYLTLVQVLTWMALHSNDNTNSKD